MISSAVSDLRNECAAFRAKLTASKRADDETLRQDIARIAAKILALTAATEGETSPIPALLAKTADDCASHSKLITILEDVAPELLAHANRSGNGA